MDRLTFSGQAALLLNATALAFAAYYFLTYEQPIIVVSLALSLLANLVNYYRLDRVESQLRDLCSGCVPNK